MYIAVLDLLLQPVSCSFYYGKSFSLVFDAVAANAPGIFGKRRFAGGIVHIHQVKQV